MQFSCPIQRVPQSWFLSFLLLSLFAGSCTSPSASTLTGSAESPSDRGDNSPIASPNAIAQNSASIASLNPDVVYQGLEHPWGMDWLPDGTLLITERPGRLQHLRADGKIYPISGIPSVFASGQGGLMDVSLHPKFAENQWVYLTYAHGTPSNNRTRVARAKLEGDRLQNWTVIFEVGQSKRGTQHFGSRLAWLPDQTLLVAIGDGGNPPLKFEGDLIRKQAQNLNTHFGKVIRLKDDGTVPEDNPFVDQPNRDPAIWTYGHRNIQGLDVNRTTGKVWATEHGSRGGDELNRLEAGQNYGWPLVSFSKEYTSNQWVAPKRSSPEFPDPLIQWTPSIAPSGLALYQGKQVPEWQGHLFAGALVDREVIQLAIAPSGTVSEVGRLAMGQRVRDVREGPDGWLYVLTDDRSGQLIRIKPNTTP